MHLHLRLRMLRDEGTDPPGLRAGEKLRHHAARREDDRVLVVDVLCRRTVRDRMEACPAVRMVEAAALEEPRRPRMLLVRARPEDTHRAIEPLVGDAAVVGDATARHAAQLVEDLGRRAELEAPPVPAPSSDVTDDLPVVARLARRLDR